MDVNDDSSAYLQAILEAHAASNAYLQSMLEELRSSKQQLGFGHPPKPRYIYPSFITLSREY